MNHKIYFLLILYLNGVLLDSCKKHKKCSDCIRDSSVCDWCASKIYDNEQRCKPKSYINVNSTWCPDSLQNPNGISTKNKDEPFNSDPTAVTQVKPQSYKMILRPGQPQPFSLSFKWAQDYPVDLYFLFDSSGTMNQMRNSTSKQSENIYNTMLSMTTDVAMGMGTFVDKNMLPYTTNIASNSSYSFRHRLSLTKEYHEFQKAIDAIPQGENRDLPEGGLDALAQAIACTNVVGWRNQSRKIVVLMTDGPYHAAGDGKSAGVFKPYNGSCFTENNAYTKELEMDYPSVSMISKMARENHVIVIFAVPESRQDVYGKLVKKITGSRMVTLDVNSDDDSGLDIVTKLREIYAEISTKVKLKVQTDSAGSARRRNFDTSFDPDCTKNITECDITRNDTKYINGTITLLNYEGFDKAVVYIAEESIGEELTLEIDIIHNCTCEEDTKSNSIYCNSQTYECGICQCNAPLYGDKCQCNRDSKEAGSDTSTCRTANMTKDCSGHGYCSCGKCSCQPDFVGPYCECYLKNCPLDNNNVVCGHGDCQCDETCKCQRGWSGDACECYDMDNACLAPNNKICNNHGKCSCGKCKCDDTADWDSRKEGFIGDFCVIKPCPECESLQCKTLTECALCLVDEEKDCSICTFIHKYTIYNELPENVNYSYSNEDWHICRRIRLDMGCYTNFAYKYDDDPYGIQMMLQRDQNCAESFYIYGGIILLCVLLVGIFTLLGWKMITYFRDRQEYLQFQKSHVPDSAPCQNPLYEPAFTTFRNPAFGKQSVQY